MHLYHYCNLKTFSLIIENGTLRLSDISKSNDSGEIQYMLPIIEKAFDASFVADHTKYLHECIEESSYMDIVRRCLYDEVLEKMGTCFVICFSQESDLLSQWRGYAHDGDGASIGIDKVGMDSAKPKGFCLQKVIYNKSNQKSLARKIADSVLKETKQKIKIDKTNVKGCVFESISNHRREIQELMAKCKSNFFKEEREWRLFVFQQDLDNDIKYIFSECNCNTFIEIDLSRMVSEKYLLDIRLGPKCKARENDIEKFLNKCSFLGKVKKSDGSYI